MRAPKLGGLAAWDLLFDPHPSLVRRTCTGKRQWAFNFGSQKRSVGRREKEGVVFSVVVVRCGRSEPGVHWQSSIGQEAQFYRRPENIAELAKPGKSRPAVRSTVRVSAFGHQRVLHYCGWYCGLPLFYGTLFSMVDLKPIVKTGNTVGWCQHDGVCAPAGF